MSQQMGIPAYNWWNECLHGVGRAGKATVFPQAIGLAATWNLNLMHRIATAISDEARAKHHEALRQGMRQIYTGLTYWSPNVNIVTNTGDRAGDEVVQLYIHHPDAAVPRPIKELKGFKRIHLEPGESKTVTFTLHTPQLGYYAEDMRYAVHSDTVEVLVGRSSQDLPLAGRFEIAGQRTEVSKVFFCLVSVK